MNVVVALNESEPWHSVLDPALALASLMSGSLDIVLIGARPANEGRVRDAIASAAVDQKSVIRQVNPESTRGLFETWDQRETVLVKRYGGAMEAGDARIAGQCDWRGAVLLVPGACDPDHRPYADRLVAVVPETGTFDSIEAWADLFGRHAHCQFVLLTVIAPDSNPNGLDLGRRFTAALHRLGETTDQLRKRGVRTTWEVRMGEPAAEIIRVAETTGTDLVLLPEPALGGPGAGIIKALTSGRSLHLLIAN